MSKASIKTFKSINDTGKRATDKQKIYDFIKRNENATKDYIIKELRIPHQTVTARVSDLEDAGVVFVTGSHYNDGTSLSKYRVERNEDKIKENAKQRLLDKAFKIKKSAKKIADSLGMSIEQMFELEKDVA